MATFDDKKIDKMQNERYLDSKTAVYYQIFFIDSFIYFSKYGLGYVILPV